MPRNVNDGSDSAPRLAAYLSAGNLLRLPDWSEGPTGSPVEMARAVAEAGFEGMQGFDLAARRAAGLATCSGGRVNQPGDADDIAKQSKDAGDVCATLHVGWGIEDEDAVDRLVGAVLNASAKHDLPLYIETHRATITQDIWRTVKIVERHPDVRFNGDFSHWYTGLEMPYGDFEAKLDFAAPVLDRVRFMHGRIGNSCCMQVPLGEPDLSTGEWPTHVEHFKSIWIRAMRGFLADARPGDILPFAPELLPGPSNYARRFADPSTGELREETDRWTEALRMVEIAKECFIIAGSGLGS